MSWLYMIAFAALVGLMFYILMTRFLSGADKKAKLIVLVVSIGIPAAGLITYQLRGAYDEVSLVASMRALGEQTGENNSMAEVKEFQRQLEQVAENHSERAEYWFLLGDLYMELEEYPSAIKAFEQASNAAPADVSIVSRLAEAQFVADGYSLTDAVKGYIDQVLSVEPLDSTVLGILGISAYRAGQFDAAIKFWERALTNLPPFSPTAQSIQASIEQARLAMGSHDSTASNMALSLIHI